ncbi:PadR family transcriptional regulator [Chryseomicrobium excrementi]|uniref:PadR family transcriptional regulator n=1 Tax=Chryseomicrobium excrementi TaxID=2041346 RepID=A0A2M9EZA1_9BACL|nr:PadR family transcriptional regulator [Chryseomicrobium excrementi]PJK16535.1 PadR family transcriptional regulator [Chryseomicrobium excrementi]
MDKRIKRYLPMTESAYYILLALTEPRHGYGIIKQVEEMTAGRLKLGSGTIYGTLSKMQDDDMITVYSDEKRKTIYEITDIGKQILRLEFDRLDELHRNKERYKGEFL